MTLTKCIKYKKLSYRKETVRLRDIKVAQLSQRKSTAEYVSFGWVVGDVHRKVSIHTASRIDTRLAVARVSRVTVRVRVRIS